VKDRRGERGAALVMALVVLVVAWSATILVSFAVAIALRTARGESQRARLAVLVDSACAEALAELALDPDAPGFADHPFAGGVIGSSIVEVGELQRDVELTARLGALERRVTARVELSAGGPTVVDWRPEGVAPATAAR
jgi:hypothetical protein